MRELGKRGRVDKPSHLATGKVGSLSRHGSGKDEGRDNLWVLLGCLLPDDRKDHLSKA